MFSANSGKAILSAALVCGLGQSGYAQDAVETETKVFGEYQDWDMLCDQTGDEIGNCRMIQAIFDAAGNRVSQAEVRALASGENVALLVIGAPLETYLPAGVGIAVDDGQEQTMAFEFCAPAGCFATVRLPQEALDLFINGGVASITLVPYANRRQVVSAEFSLSGFTAAFEQLEVQDGIER